HLLKYDSVHGVFDAEVSSEGEYLIVNGKQVRVYAEKDPSVLPMERTRNRYRCRINWYLPR
ncbi:hypothetical protein JQK62_26410, partial [Leptospira santarosai]|nr:hypothetical protein [Leptospira santarosai]